MTRLPTRVIIGGISYSIHRVRNLHDGNQGLDGHISYGNATIEIERDLDPQVALGTLWHEAVHAILTQAGYGVVSRNEGCVEALANGIIQVLSSNPKLGASHV